ncbi:hypothetical protein [Meridianimarinicoccus sp. MJW13]|uniref:hypothetical protein n=1 Tax=Meridianimarinicoccus sp. MJW13 TaxID=2720031 RepID=UPI0018670A8B|nr:hypothetical protein [Fluviibacterium sp. MJW13]
MAETSSGPNSFGPPAANARQAGDRSVETPVTDKPGWLSRPLGLGRFLGLVAAVFLGAFALTLALPHDPYIRYQSFKGTIFDRLGWVYERLAYDDTPIDVLVIGSSRTARGANVEQLEAALAERGVSAHVANVSIPASGFDWRLTVLREALKHHPEIKLVIWELVEVFPRDGHQTFGDLARPGELLSSPWLVNRTLPVNLAALPYRQMELGLASLLPEAFGYAKDFDPAGYLGPAPDHRGFNDPGWSVDAEARQTSALDHALAIAADSAQRREEITWPVPAIPDALEFGVSRAYLRDLDRLAETHGFETAFLFLPFYDGYGDAHEAEWVQQFGDYWAARFLATDPENYVDAAHGSSLGIARLTPWLADRIARSLSGD